MSESQTLFTAPESWVPVLYRCAQCGAEDTDSHLPEKHPSPVVNCWSCGAGRKVPDVGECLARNIGMFPVIPEVAK